MLRQRKPIPSASTSAATPGRAASPEASAGHGGREASAARRLLWIAAGGSQAEEARDALLSALAYHLGLADEEV